LFFHARKQSRLCHLPQLISLKKYENKLKKILPLFPAQNPCVNHKRSGNLKNPPTRVLHLIVQEVHKGVYFYIVCKTPIAACIFSASNDALP